MNNKYNLGASKTLQARDISVPISLRSAFPRALQKIAFSWARVPKMPGTRERESRNARPALMSINLTMTIAMTMKNKVLPLTVSSAMPMTSMMNHPQYNYDVTMWHDVTMTPQTFGIMFPSLSHQQSNYCTVHNVHTALQLFHVFTLTVISNY